MMGIYLIVTYLFGMTKKIKTLLLKVPVVFLGPGNILGNISTSYPGWESQAGDYTNQYSTLTTGVIHQIRSGSLSRGELGEIDAVLTGILDEYHGIADDPETTSLTKLDLLYSNGSLIKQYNYEAIYDGDDFVGSLYAILSDDNISLVDSFVATDYISSTSSNLLFNIAPSITSYSSNYVYRSSNPRVFLLSA